MNKQNKIIIGGIVVIILAFFGGMKFGEARGVTAKLGFGPAAMMAQGQGGRAGVGMGGRAGAGRQNGGFVTGQILSKDETSLTVKLPTGGSKVVILSTTTPVSKMAAGSYNDLSVGSEVMVTGSTNTNGSVNATSVELRPAPTTHNQ
jgi:hypothetical protein